MLMTKKAYKKLWKDPEFDIWSENAQTIEKLKYCTWLNNGLLILDSVNGYFSKGTHQKEGRNR